MTFWSGEVTPEERRAFQQWLDTDTRHADIWKQIQRTDNRLSTLSIPAAAPALRAHRQSTARRKTLRILGLFVGAGVLANTVRHTPQWQGAMSDYHTALGERREITLPDGTRITLNTTTAVDVIFDDVKRLVRIRNGEIFVVTAPDNHEAGLARPFFVQTSEGTVRPIGTRFNVRQDDGRSQVAVFEGAVEINPRSGSGRPTLLKAGQQTSFNAREVASYEAASTVNEVWTRGLLVAERMRLADFLAELSRYRRGFIRCDADVAELIVSGVYATDDTDRTLSSLIEVLPIRAQYLSRYWVTLQARR